MNKFAAVALAAMISTPGASIAQSFDVPFNGNFGRVHYWCAVGQEVIRNGFPVTTMIYRTSPMHRSAGQGMSFTLDGGSTGPWNAFPAYAAANMCHEGNGQNDDERRDYGDDYEGGGFLNTIISIFD